MHLSMIFTINCFNFTSFFFRHGFNFPFYLDMDSTSIWSHQEVSMDVEELIQRLGEVSHKMTIPRLVDFEGLPRSNVLYEIIPLLKKF